MSNPFDVVRQFETELCRFTGAPYAVTVSSCTMALLLAVAYHLRNQDKVEDGRKWEEYERTPINIPARTYIGVPYAIREAEGRPTFRDEDWSGEYQLRPLPVWDAARRFARGMFGKHKFGGLLYSEHDNEGSIEMQCVSFHWSKILGIQQGGAILHNSEEADSWLRKARFDGRTEGVSPAEDTFTQARAWHCYMSPEIAAEGLVRLSLLKGDEPDLPNSDYPDLSKLPIFK